MELYLHLQTNTQRGRTLPRSLRRGWKFLPQTELFIYIFIFICIALSSIRAATETSLRAKHTSAHRSLDVGCRLVFSYVVHEPGNVYIYSHISLSYVCIRVCMDVYMWREEERCACVFQNVSGCGERAR
jgi:hypothetical protein